MSHRLSGTEIKTRIDLLIYTPESLGSIFVLMLLYGGEPLLNIHLLPSPCSEGLAPRSPPPEVSPNYTKKCYLSLNFMPSTLTSCTIYLILQSCYTFAFIIYFFYTSFFPLLGCVVLKGRDVPAPFFLFPNLIQQLPHSDMKNKNDHATDCPLQLIGHGLLTIVWSSVPLAYDILVGGCWPWAGAYLRCRTFFFSYDFHSNMSLWPWLH